MSEDEKKTPAEIIKEAWEIHEESEDDSKRLEEIIKELEEEKKEN